jgi:hypothetical protein
MFCPYCAFEYAQKTNYCKRCGESLGVTNEVEAPKMKRPKLTAMYLSILAFSIGGMFMAIGVLESLAQRGLRGDELIVPFVMTLMFHGVIAGLLIWQLSRMITAYQKTEQPVIVEKHYIREAPPSQLGAPTDPLQQAVEPPSVVEHTTRQMAGKYR